MREEHRGRLSRRGAEGNSTGENGRPQGIGGRASSASSLQAEDENMEGKKAILDASKRAYSALITSLNQNQMQLVQHVSTGNAYGVWQALLMEYERKSTATRVGLIEKLFPVEMENVESVSLYVARIQGLRRKMADQDETISDTILLFILLRGLPSRFETLVTLLKMKELVLVDVVEALKNEEERQKGQEEYESAHFAGPGGKGKFKGMNRHGKEREGDGNGVSCFTCGGSGHIKYNCPENKNKKKCSLCHRIGHVPSECRATNKAEQGNFAQSDSEEEDWCR